MKKIGYLRPFLLTAVTDSMESIFKILNLEVCEYLAKFESLLGLSNETRSCLMKKLQGGAVNRGLFFADPPPSLLGAESGKISEIR